MCVRERERENGGKDSCVYVCDRERKRETGGKDSFSLTAGQLCVLYI